MALELSDFAKYAMLNGIAPVVMKVHAGNPTFNGTASPALGSMPCVFLGASGTLANCQRLLQTAVDFTGLTPSTAVTYISLWTTGSAQHLAWAALTGDTTSNASGEFRVAATTAINLTDT